MKTLEKEDNSSQKYNKHLLKINTIYNSLFAYYTFCLSICLYLFYLLPIDKINFITGFIFLFLIYTSYKLLSNLKILTENLNHKNILDSTNENEKTQLLLALFLVSKKINKMFMNNMLIMLLLSILLILKLLNAKILHDSILTGCYLVPMILPIGVLNNYLNNYFNKKLPNDLKI